MCPPDGGYEGPLGGYKGSIAAHKSPDAGDDARNNRDSGRALPMAASAVGLPQRGKGDDAEAEPKRLSVWQRAPGAPVIG